MSDAQIVAALPPELESSPSLQYQDAPVPAQPSAPIKAAAPQPELKLPAPSKNPQPDDSAPSWDAIADSKIYKSMTPAQRTQQKMRYFDTVVGPRLQASGATQEQLQDAETEFAGYRIGDDMEGLDYATASKANAIKAGVHDGTFTPEQAYRLLGERVGLPNKLGFLTSGVALKDRDVSPGEAFVRGIPAIPLSIGVGGLRLVKGALKGAAGVMDDVDESAGITPSAENPLNNLAESIQANQIDPALQAQGQLNRRPNENEGTGAAIARALGSAAGAAPLLIGGSTAAGGALLDDVAAGAMSARTANLVAGATAAVPMAVTSGVNRYTDLTNAGVDPTRAAAAAGIDAAGNEVLGVLPMGVTAKTGLPGLVRYPLGAVVGGAENVLSDEAQRRMENAVLPPEAQSEAPSTADMIGSAAPGVVFGVHGSMPHGNAAAAPKAAPDLSGTVRDDLPGGQKAPPTAGAPTPQEESQIKTWQTLHDSTDNPTVRATLKAKIDAMRKTQQQRAGDLKTADDFDIAAAQAGQAGDHKTRAELMTEAAKLRAKWVKPEKQSGPTGMQPFQYDTPSQGFSVDDQGNARGAPTKQREPSVIDSTAEEVNELPKPVRALPAPSIAVDAKGRAGTEAQFESARRDLGLTPDIERAQAAHPSVAQIDEAAHQAATSPQNDLPQPTDGQKEAGNYQMGHVKLHGLDISIENPAGSERSGTDSDGKRWSVTMADHYGYIRGTVGADKDHVDAFIGPHPESETAYVVDQINPKDGTFDEHKVILGASSENEARRIYKRNYSKGWRGLGAITDVPVGELKDRLNASPNDPLGTLKKFTGKTALKDDRLSDPEVKGRLAQMAQDAGWAEDGRTVNYDVDENGARTPIGRNSWVPHAKWFQDVQRDAPLDGNTSGKATGEAVRKAINGEPMSAAEKRHVGAMLEAIDRDRADFEALGAKGIEPVLLDQAVGSNFGVDREEAALAARALKLDEQGFNAAATDSETRDQFMDAIRSIISRHEQADRPEDSRPGEGSAPLPDTGEGAPGQESQPRQTQAEAVRKAPDKGAFSLESQKAPEAKPAALPLENGDMFGGKTATQQAVHDARIAKDQARQGVHVDAGADGGLFSSRQKQTDIADATAPSEQYRRYEKAIGEWKEVPKGMLDQIRVDERLKDGESEKLLQMANAKKGGGLPVLNGTEVHDDIPERFVLDHPRFGKVTIDRTHDVPLGAGASKDRKTVYIDQDMGLVRNIDGKTVNVLNPLVTHELREAHSEAMGFSYTESHEDAEKAEHEDLPQGISDKSYEASYRIPLMLAAEKVHSTNTPPDIIEKPYEHPHSIRQREMLAEINRGESAQPKENTDVTQDARAASAAKKPARKQQPRTAAPDATSGNAGDGRPAAGGADVSGGAAASDAGRADANEPGGRGRQPDGAVPGLKQDQQAPGSPAPVYSSGNKVFTDEAAEAARKRLLAKMRSQTNHAGLDPEMLQDSITLAGWHIEKGARTFAAFAHAMVSDLGDVVKPYLKSWYMAVKYDPRAASLAKDMSGAAEVDAADVDEVLKPRQAQAEQRLMQEPEWWKSRTGAQRYDILKASGYEKATGSTKWGSLPPELRASLDSQWGKPKEAPAAVQVDKSAPPEEQFRQAMSNRLMDRDNPVRSITEARKLYKDVTGETGDNKRIDELVEQSIVHVARHIVDKAESPEQAYRSLIELYERQPKLGTRTSTSIEQQAYSTPAPLAYLASRLAGIDHETRVLEPTAGNGMLLIGADPKKSFVNELNPDRAQALREQGFHTKSENAGTMDFPPKSFDAVIANPPFGVVRDANGRSIKFDADGKFDTTEIDHAIAMRALAGMDDDGRAVLIVGGVNKLAASPEARSDAYNGAAKRRFYWHLYQNYNVTDHFTVAGELYEKQGAGWPVDVIAINGRGKSSRELPSVDVPRIYTTWADLGGALAEVPRSLEPRANADGLPDRGGEGAPGPAVDAGSVPEPARGKTATAGEQNAEPRAGDEAAGKQPGKGRPVGSADQRPAGEGRGNPDSEQPGRGATPAGVGPVPEPRAADESAGGSGGAGAGRAEPDEPAGGLGGSNRADAVAGTESQVPYRPGNEAPGLNTLVPANMSTAIQESLKTLRGKHGSLSGYVAEKLGYNRDDIGKYFSAEQVDALALAMNAIDKGRGFIIGDQTGIGKGRVVAGVIKFALRNGKTPVFVTEKPNLYADIYRDLTDIGVDHVRPLMTNGGETVPLDESGNAVLKTPTGARHNADLDRMANSLDLGEHNMVFTTYSQMQTLKGAETSRMRFLRAFAPNAVVIFDESHNAGGNDVGSRGKKGNDDTTKAGRAAFARELVNSAHSVFYSSATYAKRPSVMDLYSRTDMSLAVDKPSALPDAIQAGGVPLQQVVASMLAKAGQYIRRERSFAGIDYNTPVVPVDRAAAERISSIMLAVKTFDDAKQDAVAALDKQMKKEGKSLRGDGSTGGAGAQSTNFTSLMHNVIDQMLLALKADAAADHAIDAIKRGEKPVITVANTMGSFIEQYAEDAGLKPGDAMALSFKNLLRRYLERSRDITTKDSNGNVQRRRLTDDELGPLGVNKYKAALKLIESGSAIDSIPASPIDWIHNRIRQAGFTSGEITGRNHIIDYGSGDTPIYRMRSGRETSIAGRRAAITAFNGGKTDAMILNQAGSTGLSLHASEKFADQRPRRMVIAQPERNIDTHMQMLGRVNRTGQVKLPTYDQLVADIPAEKRPAAVLAKKMASLNANTTASRSSALTSKSVVDFINEYGDQVVSQLMADMPEVHEKLGEPLMRTSDSDTGLEVDESARKVTGRIPMLPVAEQEKLYEQIESGYKEAVTRAEAMGENALEARLMPLDARPQFTVPLTEAKSEDSPFSGAAYAEQSDVKRLGKPYEPQVVLDRINGALGTEGKSLPELSRAGIVARNKVFAESEQAISDYRDGLIKAMGDDVPPDAVEGKLANFNYMAQAWRQAIGSTHIGQTVRLVLKDGTPVYGVVMDMKHKPGVKNPVALGSWNITIGLADAMREVTIPLSQLAVGMEKEGKVSMLHMNDGKTLGGKDVLDEFAAGQSESREQRVIVTGNLLGGFSKVGKGQVINFTDDAGRVRQGILMPKSFDMKAFADAQPVRVPADRALKFFQQAPRGTLTTADGLLRVSKLYDDYFVSTPMSKAEGGQYYLDQGVRQITGDFQSKGNTMGVRISPEQFDQLARHLQDVMHKPLETNTFKDEARAAGGKSAFDMAQGTKSPAAAPSLKESPAVAAPKVPEFDPGVAPLSTKNGYASIDDQRAALGRLARSISQSNGVGLPKLEPAELPTGIKQAVGAIARLFGQQVVPFRRLSGEGFDGAVIRGGTIYLNAEAKNPHTAVMMHELMHSMRREAPDLYNTLHDALAPSIHGEADYAKTRMGEGPFPKDKVHEEILADYLADHASDRTFWNDLADRIEKREPGLWTKVARWITDLYDRFLGQKPRPLGAERFVKDFQAQRDLLLDTMAEYSRRGRAGQKERGADGAPSFLRNPFAKEKEQHDDLAAGMNENHVRAVGRGAIRNAFAVLDRVSAKAERALHDVRTQFDQMLGTKEGRQAIRESVYQFETNQRVQNPLLRDFFSKMSVAFDQRVEAVRAMGRDMGYIENYFPHLYKDPKKASQWIQQYLAKRPLEGTKGWTKQRYYQTLEDARQAGLEPLSENPADMMQAHLRQMDKYIALHQIVTDLKARGLVLDDPGTFRLPAGYAKVHDPALHGKLVPEVIARDLNTILAPSMYDSAWWRSFRAAQNAFVSANFGFSAFHATLTTTDTVAAHIGDAIQRTFMGDAKGAVESFAKAAASPWMAPKGGSKLIKQSLGEVPADANTEALLRMLEQGGQRAFSSPTDLNDSYVKMRRAMNQGDWAGMAKSAPLAMLENVTPLIHKYLVPSQKMTARVLAMKTELDRLIPMLQSKGYDLNRGDYAAIEQTLNADAIRQIAGRVVDQVDQRLGQMNYRNLFMDRKARDILQAVFSSYGWQHGTVATIAGGYKDLAHIVKPQVIHGPLDKAGKIADANFSRLSPRTAYLMALHAVVIAASVGVTYALTGQGPQSALDLFTIRTGRFNPDGSPERILPPSYVKDEIELAAHGKPVRNFMSMAGNKLNPVLRFAYEVARNRDFRDNQIYNPDDDALTQAKQIGGHLASTFAPFALEGAMHATHSNSVGELASAATTPAGFGSIALNALGLNPAPAHLTRSAFDDYVTDHAHHEAKTPEEQAQSTVLRERAEQMRAGLNPDLSDLTAAEQRSVRSRATGSFQESVFKHLDLPSKLAAWDTATDDERAKFNLRKHIMDSWARGALGKVPVDQKPAMQKRLEAVQRYSPGFSQ